MAELPTGIIVRYETPEDIAAIAAINDQAFGGTAESALIARLRAAGAATISLVAEVDGEIVGHILFSPMEIRGPHGIADALAVAPMAVRPDMQRRGIGSRLIREALEKCRTLGASRVLLLGHADFYPRFGFRPASGFGIKSEYDVPDEVFMALELVPGAFHGIVGTAHYHKAFGGP